MVMAGWPTNLTILFLGRLRHSLSGLQVLSVYLSAMQSLVSALHVQVKFSAEDDARPDDSTSDFLISSQTLIRQKCFSDNVIFAKIVTGHPKII